MKVFEYFELIDNITQPCKDQGVYVDYRHVGIECERERVSIPAHYYTKYIQFTPEDSLRGNGIEIKNRFPVRGKDIIYTIKEIADIYKHQKWTHSFRTSDHYHINVRDFEIKDIDTLIKNVLRLEATLFSIGEYKFNRVKNSYCIPLWNFFNIENLKKYTGGKSFNIFNTPKYLSTNFNSHFGTVEFRMFESTNSFLTILNRINLLLEIVENSKKGVYIYDGCSLEEGFKKIAPMSFNKYKNFIRESPLEISESLRLSEYSSTTYRFRDSLENFREEEDVSLSGYGSDIEPELMPPLSMIPQVSSYTSTPTASSPAAIPTLDTVSSIFANENTENS